jgi:hypothetical protein
MTPEDEEFARIEAEINRRQPVPVKTYHDGKPWPVAPKPWVGLTEEERNDLEDFCKMIIGKAAFDAIESKLREKNT